MVNSILPQEVKCLLGSDQNYIKNTVFLYILGFHRHGLTQLKIPLKDCISIEHI